MQDQVKVERITEHDTMSRSKALMTHDHYSTLAHPEPDSPEFQEGVIKLKKQFAVFDREVHKPSNVVTRGIGRMILALDKMEPFLSRKGEHHEQHYVQMLIAAGLPTWKEYKKQIADEFLISVRTVQRKLAEHRGHPKEQQPRRLPKDEEETEEDEPFSYGSPKEQVTKWMKRQRKVLSGGDGPVDADPIRDGESRIDTALQLLNEFQLAIDEGLLVPVPQVATLRHLINMHDHSELTKVPLHLREANDLVAQLHRHHKPIRVAKFSIGASKNGKLVGAAICMRPACRALDDGRTIEVCRLATYDTKYEKDAKDACSFLYGACARIAREMGYDKIMTYLLDSEPGISVRGAGWTLEKTGCGGTPQGLRKNRPNGHEVSAITYAKKQRWARLLQTQANKKAVSSVSVE